MRVSSGHLRGRLFDSPKSRRTHPMSERVKTAMFNSLGNISGMTLLDPFAGSGAIGIEAISRGASFVQAVERDSQVHKIIVKNIEQLQLSQQMKVSRANCATWSKHHQEMTFDLIICDPPYDDLQLSTINRLVAHLKNEGLMVLSHSGREATPTVNGVVVVDNRLYGDAALSYYRLSQR